MRAFLFLYPVHEFVERETRPPVDARITIARLNAIIDWRYRRKGYGIHWLLPSRKRQPKAPDFCNLDERIQMHGCDAVITSGVPWRPSNPFGYARNVWVISQLVSVDELVVGGFHQDDCVKRIARFAYRNGISTAVDEDTTDQLFKRSMLFQLAPVVRSREECVAAMLRFLVESADELGEKVTRNAIRLHRDQRLRQPWLTPI